MSNDAAEVDMKDVELNEVDAERQPIHTGNGDANSAVKNGTVKVKIPDEQGSKFTGLTKEELLNVAGTPGWVRARWGLLILFWLGWLGMLAGAIVIIVQAPRCKPIPVTNWWDSGALYRIGDVKASKPELECLEDNYNNVAALKVKGLIIGPIHVSSTNNPDDLNLTAITSSAGNLTQLETLIGKAHKKSISVVLDLTPNYKGSDPWFSNASLTNVADKILVAVDYWLRQGFDGILLRDVEHAVNVAPSLWATIRETVSNHSSEEKKKLLIGVTKSASPDEVNELLNKTGVDLLLSDVLKNKSGTDLAQAVQTLYSKNGFRLVWNLGDLFKENLASVVDSLTLKLHQLLLFTLPGTPVFNYGDEIGLTDNGTVSSPMVCEGNQTEKTELSEMESSLSEFFKQMSGLRTKELSLKHGDYVPLFNSTTTLAYLREWDQSERYITAFNWSPIDQAILQLKHNMLPEKATVVVSTDEVNLPHGQSVDLAQFVLRPQQAVMLKFPYV